MKGRLDPEDAAHAFPGRRLLSPFLDRLGRGVVWEGCPCGGSGLRGLGGGGSTTGGFLSLVKNTATAAAQAVRMAQDGASTPTPYLSLLAG